MVAGLRDRRWGAAKQRDTGRNTENILNEDSKSALNASSFVGSCLRKSLKCAAPLCEAFITWNRAALGRHICISNALIR